MFLFGFWVGLATCAIIVLASVYYRKHREQVDAQLKAHLDALVDEEKK